MLNWALKYLGLGFSVIPLVERSKKPLIDWKEFQKRIASQEEIKEWFNKWPDANVGIVTGSVSGVAIVDLDGPEGLDHASKLSLISNVISLTGSGRQLWYSTGGNVHKPIVNAVRIRQGIDIRGEGGYVVAPPSVHPNGKRYRWLSRPVSNVESLPIFPISVLNSAETVSQTKKFEGKEEGWIAKALEEMKIGNIDNTLVSILGRLRHDGYSSADALALLRGPAREAGAINGHLEDKIKNVWARYEPAQQRAGTLLPSLSEESETVEEFLKEEEPVEWIIPNLIAKNSIGFCVGLPESAKTWLMMDLAISVSSGMKWIDCFPSVSVVKVLFVEQERFRGETKRRFRQLMFGRSLTSNDMENLHIKSGSSIKLDLEQSYNAFVKLLDKVSPDLVIVDSLATFHTKEENNRMEIQSVMEKVKVLRSQFKCAFFFISHSNKFAFQAAKEGQEPDVSLMAGSIALPAAAETVLMVTKAKGGGSVVNHVKSTLGPKVPSFGIVVEDTNKGIVVRGVK